MLRVDRGEHPHPAGPRRPTPYDHRRERRSAGTTRGAATRADRQQRGVHEHKREWSPDEPSGTDPFEQGDEALAERTELDPTFAEALELDPSLDPTLQTDDRELEEAGAEFDDPEGMWPLTVASTTPTGWVDPPIAGRGREPPTTRAGTSMRPRFRMVTSTTQT